MDTVWTSPACQVKIADEFGYLYCAICPFTGDLFGLLLPWMKKECFEIFLKEFQRQLPETAETLMILDGAGSHQQSVVSENSGLELQKLPAACPELNPVERFFQELRKDLSNQVFETIAQIEQKIQELLEKYWSEPNLVIRLVNKREIMVLS